MVAGLLIIGSSWPSRVLGTGRKEISARCTSKASPPPISARGRLMVFLPSGHDETDIDGELDGDWLNFG